MKTTHLSIITGFGIATVVAVGIYILIFPISIISNYDNPSCNQAPNVSRDEITLKKITWLSVMEIEKNQTKLDCTTVNQETFLHIPKLEQALNRADQCEQGQDNVCSFPSGGISLEMAADGIMSVEDSKNYRASLTQDEAHFLLDNVNLGQVGSLVAGDVNYDGKYYQVLLYTNDESVNNDEYIRDTGLTWVNGQSPDSSIACASSDYDITITYGSQLFSEVTNIPCTSAQNKDVYNNSVFFENTDKQASSNWSNYITGTVSATNAFEYDSLGNSYQWSTSNNKDVNTCTSPPTITTSNVITSGHLYSGGTATWVSLSSQPYAC